MDLITIYKKLVNELNKDFNTLNFIDPNYSDNTRILFYFPDKTSNKIYIVIHLTNFKLIYKSKFRSSKGILYLNYFKEFILSYPSGKLLAGQGFELCIMKKGFGLTIDNILYNIPL